MWTCPFQTSPNHLLPLKARPNARIQHHPTLLNPTLLDEVAKRMQHVGFNTSAREVWVQNLPRILRKQTRAILVCLKKWPAIDRLWRGCLVALALLEILEEEDNIHTKRGRTRHWIKRRGEKGYINNIVRELMIAAAETLRFLATGETYRSLSQLQFRVLRAAISQFSRFQR